MKVENGGSGRREGSETGREGGVLFYINHASIKLKKHRKKKMKILPAEYFSNIKDAPLNILFFLFKLLDVYVFKVLSQ